MWHVSIAEHDGHGVMRTAAIRNKTALFTLGRKLLQGVGNGETFEKTGDLAIHVRRSLSDEEIAGLNPEWLAIPAIDRA